MQRFAMDIFNNGLASTVVAGLDLQKRFNLTDPTTSIIADGGAQTLAEYIVDYFQNKPTFLQTGDYFKVMDDVLFNVLIYALISRFNVSSTLYSFVRDLPIPERAKELVLRGVLSASAKTLYETMDNMNNIRFHPLFRYVLHPSDFLKNI